MRRRKIKRNIEVLSKTGGIRIITFRDTTRMQSKSNCCIWHTTLVFWLLTRPGSSNSSKFSFWLIRIFLLSRTETNGGTYCSLWGVTIQNLFVWEFFKFVWWPAHKRVFQPPGSLHLADIKVWYGPECARVSFKTLMSLRCNNNIIAFLTAGLTFKRGSVQPVCILGGLRFRSTRGTIF